MQCANLTRRNKFDFFFRFRAGTEPIGRLLPAGPQELSAAGSAPLLTPSLQVGGPATPRRSRVPLGGETEKKRREQTKIKITARTAPVVDRCCDP
jgi:hypothetical protein